MNGFIGRKVTHEKFGAGLIIAAEAASGSEWKLTIRFESGDQKTVLSRFVDVLPAAPSKPAPRPPAVGLLAAVLAAPDDLELRREYGEQLASQDDALGELILTQLALEQEQVDPTAREALEQREHVLLRAHHDAWQKRFRLQGCSHRFRRGLLDHLSVGTDPIVGWERSLDAHPIRSLVVGSLAHLRLALQRDGARRLTQLTFQAFPGQHEGVTSQLAKTQLSLAELNVDSVDLHVDTLATLIAAHPNLEALALRWPTRRVANPIEVPSVRSNLRRLCLFDWRTGPGLASTLATWEAACDLVELDLGSCDLGDEGARVLAAIPFSSLERLELHANEIGPAGVAALLSAPFARGLRSLGLENNPLGARGAACLATANLPTLRELDLAWTSLGDMGIVALSESSLPDRLQSLSVHANELGPAGAMAMAARGWPALEKLRLSRNHLSDEGVESLCGAWMPVLRELDLRCCEITDRGANALARATSWSALRRLVLDENRFSLAAAETIGEAPALRGVEHLSLVDIGLDAAVLPDGARRTR